jgi:hypothetical protein
MKNWILVSFLSLALAGGTDATAHEKNSKESSCCSDDMWGGDFHCYRAWKKEFKREKKLCKAESIECSRPWAAERKRRKACKKAWKRDVIEYDHKYGYDHYYWWY